VAYQQGANTVLPLRVYEVPMVDLKVPAISESAYFDYDSVRTYTFTRDITGAGVPYAPIDGR